MSNIRTEVLAQIELAIRAAEDAGLDGFRAARARFPEVPVAVVAEALAMVDMQRTEDWWNSIEKTVDGEIVKAAITKAGGAT
jgi:hypothetical protein